MSKCLTYFDFTNARPNTVRGFESQLRTYDSWCNEAGQDRLRPDHDWIYGKLSDFRESKGLLFARRLASAVRYLQQTSMVATTIDDERIRELLRTDIGVDPLRVDVADVLGARRTMGIQVLIDESYSVGYAAKVVRCAREWIVHCDGHSINPLAPSMANIAHYIGNVVEGSAHVRRSHRNSISAYLRQHHVKDVSRDPRIDALLAQLKTDTPRARRRVVSRDQLKAILQRLGASWLDRRDRVLVQLLQYHQMRASSIALLDAAWVSITEQGVLITHPVFPDGSVFFAGDEDPILDMRSSFAALLETMQGKGPLFQALDRRGEWTGKRISPDAVMKSAATLAQRAGVPAHDLLEGIHAGAFINHMREKSLAIAAQQHGYASLQDAAKKFSAFLSEEQRAEMVTIAARKNRWKTASNRKVSRRRR